jgi:hypothetical protein
LFVLGREHESWRPQARSPVKGILTWAGVAGVGRRHAPPRGVHFAERETRFGPLA